MSRTERRSATIALSPDVAEDVGPSLWEMVDAEIRSAILRLSPSPIGTLEWEAFPVAFELQENGDVLQRPTFPGEPPERVWVKATELDTPEAP